MKRRKVKRGTGPPPDPVVVLPSDEYVGNDGPWSTFNVRLGSPPQALKMIASTSSVETLVVDSSGCTAHDPKDCTTDRGQLFNASASKTWENWANGSRYSLDDDRGLPFHANGIYGTDTINFLGRAHGMDPEGVSIPHHVIARITAKEYFIGAIGLNPRQLSPEKRRNGHTSNLREMKDRGLIPSLAYGYTAGARNRRQGMSSRPAKASLVLGGYDASLRKPNDVNFRMGPQENNRDLAVWVKSMNILGNSSDSSARQSVSAAPFTAIIDSGVSPFFLPKAVCDSFAKYLQLRYNNTLGMYLINETEHIRLENDSPSMEITLSNEAVGGDEITVLLPYASLELRLTKEYPNATSWSRYFPIRPAENPSQFSLGRVFLQEAYLTANYELRNFSIAQRAYESEKNQIIPIRDPTRPAADDISNAATYGLIAGGCALAGLLILLLVWRCQRRRCKRADAEKGICNSVTGKTELDSTTRTVFELDQNKEIFELTGKPSRVEAINPDMKCAFDDEVELRETVGPFELPANEDVEPMSPATDDGEVGVALPGPSSDSSRSNSGNEQHTMNTPSTVMEELISPIEGSISSGMYTISTFNHTISPITPTEPTALESISEANRRSEVREEKR